MNDAHLPNHETDPAALERALDALDLDAASSSVLHVLADGPLRDDALLAALRADGSWGPVGDLPDDDFAEVVEDLVPDGVWRTQMAMWVDVDGALDGAVFTHRVTEAEVEAGSLEVLPDLTVVDWGVSLDRVMADGTGPVVTDYSAAGGFAGGALAGPDGWLAGVAAGDVIGLRLVGRSSIAVERVDAADLPEPSDPAVASLARAFRGCFERWNDDHGGDLAEAALDLLVEEPTAFVRPGLPLSELASAARLERRGLEWGPVDRPWLSARQRALRERADLLVSEEPDWLAAPFSTVVGALVAWAGSAGASSDPSPGATSVRGVADVRTALSTDGVAGLVGELLRGGGPNSTDIAEFVESIGGTGSDAATSAAHLLLGVDHVLARRFAAAEVEFRTALERDPGNLDAAVELGVLASDRGDVAEADRRFRQAGGPDAWLEATAAVLPDRSTGRNEPCPCGSGRKFKQCCLVTPRAPVEQRGPWYRLRLARHLTTYDSTSLDLVYSVMEETLPEDVGPAFDHGALEAIAVIGARQVDDYIDTHSEHLSDVDRGALEAWRDATVRPWTAVLVGDEWHLTGADGTTAQVADAGHVHVDAATGRTAAQVVPLGDSHFVALSVPLSDIAAIELEGLLGDHDAVGSVVEWALWYAAALGDA